MSKIKIEDIRQTLAEHEWELISTEYINLNTDLHYLCPEGHDVYGPWSKFKKTPKCPICAKNVFTVVDDTYIPKKPGSKRILALDQASHTSGWAIYDGNKLVKYGSFEVEAGTEIERCHRVKMWLLSMIRNWKPDVVGLEDIQFQNNLSGGHSIGVTVFQTLAHLQGILMETCYEAHIEFELCNTNTWRHAVGVKGQTRADKKRSMQLKVKEWYDVTVTDDCADAIGIGYYLVNKLGLNLEIVNWE